MSSVIEKQRLEKIAANPRYGEGFNAVSVTYSFEIMQRYIVPGSILEMGPAEGHMTDLLVRLDQPLTCVDGGKPFCDAIAARYPQVEAVHSLFEEYRPDRQFNSIILGHVLEHVEDPVAILSLARNWLAPGGRILAGVPNARSLHRQAAVIMGLLPFEETLNEADRYHGHRRVYTPETFRRDFMQAGLEIEMFGGYWLKPLSNAQLEASHTPEMIRAFMKLGERYPDIAGEIYIVAKNPDRR
jgi:2-polyprenyl-3-methyl-5-hydroxy-6-metoxy-1,4-benzoquinol methylase